MGILKAAAGSAGGVLAEQWKECYYCPGLGRDDLVVRGKRMEAAETANTRGSDTVVSDGSVMIVNEGQCGLVSDGGEVAGICPEPGENIFRSDRSPSIFSGDGMKGMFRDMARRFTFGGEVPVTQLVFYVNTKELPGDLLSVPPTPFRIRDRRLSLDLDATAECDLHCTWRIADPALFFTKVSGPAPCTRSRLDSRMDAELISAFRQTLPDMEGLRPSELGEHIPELAEAVRTRINELWRKERGIEAVTVSVCGLRIREMEPVTELQRDAVFLSSPASCAGEKNPL